jgi:hypothetical protein
VSGVQNGIHGVVSIVAGQVQFVATPGYIGEASFDYLSDDGHGGQTWATAFVEVKPPPNLYPTIDVYAGSHHSHWFGGSAYYNPIELWQSFGYVIHDESPGSVVMGITPTDSGYLTSAPSGGGFEYYKYDSWGADGLQMYFDIHLTDQNGVSNTAHVALGCDGDTWNSLIVTHDHTGLFASPVLIDLMGDGFAYQAADVSTVRFDVNADGSADQIAWVGQDDGVLVWDKDANGQISDASEFSFQSLKAGAHTDLEGLQALDSNHNGTLDAGDTAWTQFGVWQDKNGNGNTDATEFKTLDQLGFASIHLQSNGQMHEATAVGGDVVVMGEAAFTRTDGSTGAVADAMLAYVPTQPGAQPNAEINRMALLFNQMVNTAGADSAEPLGFVPVEPDMGAHYAPLLAAQNDHQLLQTA